MREDFALIDSFGKVPTWIEDNFQEIATYSVGSPNYDLPLIVVAAPRNPNQPEFSVALDDTEEVI
jgi:hypothetical protein